MTIDASAKYLIAHKPALLREIIGPILTTVGLVGLLLAGGCSILPGTFVVPTKTAEIKESPEEPATLDFTLLQVTPMLVRQLREEAATKEASDKTVVLPKATSVPYRLGKQDVLRIFVWGNPDLTPVTTSVTSSNMASTPAGRVIDEHGDIFFPMVGSVHAEGMTISEFRKVLAKRLSRFIIDPQIDVDVAAFRSQKVFVSGQVKTPGIVPITDQPMRLLDALGLAGGANDNSDLYAVVLTRGKVSVTLNVDKLYYSGDAAANVLMQNGDVLTVPDRMMRKVFVLGEVGNAVGSNQARSYVMRRGDMTLTEVLADAGGLSPYTSAANEVYVIRLDNTGKPVVYQLNASQPQALLLAEQFPIQPRDLVFVNPTSLTMIGRFIGQFMPILQAANTATATPF